MKKILSSVAALLLACAVMPLCHASFFRILITLEEFREMPAHEQNEVVIDYIGKANVEYKGAETIEEIYDLAKKVEFIRLCIEYGKPTFTTERIKCDRLYEKIKMTIEDYEKSADSDE